MDRAGNRREAKKIAEELESLSRGEKRSVAAIRQTAYELGKIITKLDEVDQTIEAFFKEYLQLKSVTLKPSSLARYVSVIDGFVNLLGVKKLWPIENLSAREFEDYVNSRLEQGITVKTVSNDLKNLNPAFTRAVNLGTLPNNPIKALDLKPGKGRPHKPFKPDEIFQMLQCLEIQDLSLSTAQDDWRIAIGFGYFTGMRLGDCANRRWSDIDWSQRCIRVVPQKTSKSNEMLEIPIHDELYIMLQDLKNRSSSQWVTLTLRDDASHSDRSWLSKQFSRIMTACNVDPMEIENPVSGRKYAQRSFHSLRTTCNSLMANSDVHQEIRKRIVGHASTGVNDVYTSLDLESKAKAVNKIPGLKRK